MRGPPRVRRDSDTDESGLWSLLSTAAAPKAEYVTRLSSVSGPREARRQYFHDPAAPIAHGLLPAVFAAARNPQGQVLLVCRADDDNWELPGGRVEVGESAAQSVVREVAEESGVDIEVTGVVGVYTDPAHVLAYPNGEVRQQFAVCFHAHAVAGEVHPDQSETTAAGWFYPHETRGLPMHPTMRQRLVHALSEPHLAYFD
jgi:8-oxo-dGTP pyrophosphatase MutT (NUDIX family)